MTVVESPDHDLFFSSKIQEWHLFFRLGYIVVVSNEEKSKIALLKQSKDISECVPDKIFLKKLNPTKIRHSFLTPLFLKANHAMFVLPNTVPKASADYHRQPFAVIGVTTLPGLQCTMFTIGAYGLCPETFSKLMGEMKCILQLREFDRHILASPEVGFDGVKKSEGGAILPATAQAESTLMMATSAQYSFCMARLPLAIRLALLSRKLAAGSLGGIIHRHMNVRNESDIVTPLPSQVSGRGFGAMGWKPGTICFHLCCD